MDLDPETGSYKLSASVPGVCMNKLRKTLGIRPPPYAVAGAVRGVLHCSGPLEQPVFAGEGSGFHGLWFARQLVFLCDCRLRAAQVESAGRGTDEIVWLEIEVEAGSGMGSKDCTAWVPAEPFDVLCHDQLKECVCEHGVWSVGRWWRWLKQSQGAAPHASLGQRACV